MKKIIVVLFFWLPVTVAFSQQLPHFSQYMLNGYLANPAVAGSENYLDLKTGARNQWSGFEGAPESYYITAHLPLYKMDNRFTATSIPFKGEKGTRALFKSYKDKDVWKGRPHHGLGFTALTDKAAALKRTEVGFTYAYHLPVSNSTKMSVGVTAGVSVYKVDQSKLNLSDQGDPAFTSGNYNRTTPSITAGALLYSKRYFAGITAAQVFQDELELSAPSDANTDRAYTHYFVMGGYKVVLSPRVSVLPSVMLKHMSPAPLSADFNMKLLYNDKVWIGVSYQLQKSFVLLGGINLKNTFQVGYAYDLSMSGIGRTTNGSHELVLSYLFNNRGHIFSPSDFW